MNSFLCMNYDGAEIARHDDDEVSPLNLLVTYGFEDDDVCHDEFGTQELIGGAHIETVTLADEVTVTRDGKLIRTYSAGTAASLLPGWSELDAGWMQKLLAKEVA